LDHLLTTVATALGHTVTFHDEVRDEARAVRPDYAVRVAGAINGYVEVKRPEANLDPQSFTGHNLRQWERQRDLPNLLYTNGTEWRFYRDGEVVSAPVQFEGGLLASVGASLTAPAEFELMLRNFLAWKPAPITNVGSLVRAVAPLTRLLRGEVLDQLDAEERAVRAGADASAQPFSGMARDWRALLFPHATPAQYADGYAQTVTFALLLARTRGIDLTIRSLHDVGQELGKSHSLMGRALQLLTAEVAADFQVTLDLLVRVVGAVDWSRVRRGRRDAYLHLYEHFLSEYDPELRKASGSYYTPFEVVEPMVRLAEEAVISRLGKERGYADPDVVTVDPAMGTGTYLQTVLERVAERAVELDGEGASAQVLSDVAKRVVGFELQLGPFAVAELRAADLLESHGAATPEGGLHLYVTDTLDDPYADQAQLSFALEAIAQSRRRANRVKASENVTVVVGNPPYAERAEGIGGWVERGGGAHGDNARAILDDFRFPENGKVEYVLKNLYVYFWRWATWKVWESTVAENDSGVVCFITTAAYIKGRGFKGMRDYLRRTADEGWIIALTPEGQTPDVPTRIFPGVRQTLAIGLFVRRAGGSATAPAVVHYREVHGKQTEKFSQLQAIRLDGDGWRDARTGWADPFTPAAESAWDDYPAVDDVFPWTSPGVKPNRTWVYSPSQDTLQRRWRQLVAEPGGDGKSTLFKETTSTLATKRARLPQADSHDPAVSLDDEHRQLPDLTPVAFRAFDRQWLIADSRLIDRPRVDLWKARVPEQVFVVEQHDQVFDDGPGLHFATNLPDMHTFNGRGGRVVPLLHPDGTPNVAPGLLDALRTELGTGVTAHDLVAYLAAVVAQPAFTHRFGDELRTPGVRVPLTSRRDLWELGVTLGREVLWVQSFGELFNGEHPGSIRFDADDPRRVVATAAVAELVEELAYDSDAQVVRIGTGAFGPVPREVWDYEVGGRNVLHSWWNYRKRTPGGRKSSPLDDVHATAWQASWTTELNELLTVLRRLVELEPAQAALLVDVLGSPVLSFNQLASVGTKWPTRAADRRPRFPFSFGDD